MLKVDPAYLTRERCFQAEAGGLVGFAAVEDLGDGVALLEHLWVAPLAQGRRLGAALFRHVADDARARGFRLLRLYADPPAAGFYVRMGAVKVGERPSRISFGPTFPVFELPLSPTP